ncbi:hypothetical protein [Jeongeupia naejangsanensis]|uniref:Uncharacterized protein n=1 Tax=Jeongeupia naejangsanensis TaxID=613195 RepID=A0ABS2BHF9_9NEIS|nr:hypothetical protein [Jeongeupia naejangsanensis]MBM3115038.1 hypothetical protein [Jeongeupia naejangsanensis]
MKMKSRVAVMSLSGFLVVGIANAAGDVSTARISDIENQIRLAREQLNDNCLESVDTVALQEDSQGDGKG